MNVKPEQPEIIVLILPGNDNSIEIVHLQFGDTKILDFGGPEDQVLVSIFCTLTLFMSLIIINIVLLLETLNQSLQ